MKYILIILYLQGGVATAEFDSAQACRYAGEFAQANLRAAPPRLGYVCVPKGNQ